MPRPSSSPASRAHAAEEELHEVRETRARAGLVARELELRALAEQQRRGFSAFLQALDTAARVASKRGPGSARNFLRTHALADAYMVGLAGSPAVRWRLRTLFRSGDMVERLLRLDQVGERVRADLGSYVAENVFEPGLRALWKELGGEDQDQVDL